MKLGELEETVITGLDEELNLKKITEARIYPNPAQSYFEVSLSDQLTMELDWVIFDQRGVELLSGQFESGEDVFTIDASSLPVGMHLFVTSAGENARTIRKIIIQR